jgi:hypothetical protein
MLLLLLFLLRSVVIFYSHFYFYVFSSVQEIKAKKIMKKAAYKEKNAHIREYKKENSFFISFLYSGASYVGLYGLHILFL